MKTKLTLLACLFAGTLNQLYAQGTAFTYQGRLNKMVRPPAAATT